MLRKLFFLLIVLQARVKVPSQTQKWKIKFVLRAVTYFVQDLYEPSRFVSNLGLGLDLGLRLVTNRVCDPPPESSCHYLAAATRHSSVKRRLSSLRRPGFIHYVRLKAPSWVLLHS